MPAYSGVLAELTGVANGYVEEGLDILAAAADDVDITMPEFAFALAEAQQFFKLAELAVKAMNIIAKNYENLGDQAKQM